MCLFVFQKARREYEEERETLQWEEDRKCVVDLTTTSLSPAELELRTRQYAEERQKRLCNLLEHIRNSRRLFFEQTCPKP